MAAEYYDELETRDPEQRERELFLELPQVVARAKNICNVFASFSTSYVKSNYERRLQNYDYCETK